MFALLFRLLSRLPLSGLHALGGALGALAAVFSTKVRATIAQNLAQANIQTAGLPGRVAAEMGKSLLELPYLWLRPAADILARTTTTDWELIEAARNLGKGIIFLTPHLGCFEVTAQYFAVNPRDGAPITVLYRPPKQTALRGLIESSRARGRMTLVPADIAGVRKLVRALKRGEAVGLLPDQVPSRGEGVWAPFFGRAAYTMTLPARLAEMTGATILLAVGERLPRARGWVVRIFPLDEALTGTAAQRAGQLNRAMEDLIRRTPAQYFWGYNRYKIPRGVERPPEVS